MTSSVIIGIIGLAVLIALVLYGFHIAIVLGTVGFFGLVALKGWGRAISMACNQTFTAVSTFDYAVIPMFVMMGMLATSVGISDKCYDSLAKIVGRVPGGLGIATTWSCAAFGTLNGSALVTASVFAKVSVPSMRKHGYDKNLAYGLCSAAGNIGQFIPPSVLLVMYGALSQDSIGKLLMAGISPGIALSVAFSIIMVIISLTTTMAPRTTEKYSVVEKLASLKAFIPIAVVALIVIGGIFGGLFSSAEAGAVGCVVFFVYALIFRVPGSKIVEAFTETVKTCGMMFIILMSASLFSRFMVVSGLAPLLVEILTGINLTPNLFLIGTVIIYLILGCFMDAISSMSIVLPLLLPVAVSLGVDTIHFAMVSLLAMHCGGITPPVGMCVFCVNAVAEKDVEVMGIFKGALPFLLAMIVLCILYVYVPVLSTILPDLMI